MIDDRPKRIDLTDNEMSGWLPESRLDEVAGECAIVAKSVVVP